MRWATTKDCPYDHSLFNVNLLTLQIAATNATADPKYNAYLGALPLNKWNSSATLVAPVVCPINLAIANIPLALPLRLSGADVIKTLLLGDWNIPNPNPQQTSRHAISRYDGESGNCDNIANPNDNNANPTPPKIPALTLPINEPANGAANMIVKGHAENNIPVSDSLNPYVFSKKNGMETIANI